MRRLLLLVALVAVVAAIAIPSASATVRVLPLSAQPNGWTYHQWHTIYNRRFLERDFRSFHSLVAERNGMCGQRVGQVKARLLPFPFGEGNVSLSARCRVEPGTRLVVDVAGAIGIYAGPERLKAYVAGEFASITAASLTLDGRPLVPHVIQTPFVHASIPFFNAQVIAIPSTTASFIGRDYFAILSPIPRGLHVLTQSATYDLGDGPQTASMTFYLNVR